MNEILVYRLVLATQANYTAEWRAL